jgi:chromosome segregation ATPase
MEVKIMARRVTNQEWCDLMNRIHSGRSCLTQEAEKLGMTLEEIIAIGDETHTGGDAEREKEWKQTKRESSKRDKLMAKPRKRSKKSVATPEPATSSAETAPESSTCEVSEPASELSTEEASEQPVIVEVATEQPMPEEVTLEQLLERKSNSEKKMELMKLNLESTKEILSIRQQTLENSRLVLEKAQNAFSQAEAEVLETQKSIQSWEKGMDDVRQKLQELETEINNKKVYLVNPLYRGELPEIGTFISSSEIEDLKGISVEEVPAEYIPEDKVKGVFLFEKVSEYRKAIAFVGLVIKYELEGKSYNLIVEDERVEALMDMNI